MEVNLPKIDVKTDKRILIVSKIASEVWKDVGSSYMKFVISRKIKEVIADVVFHIILELKEKFEFTKSGVKKQGKIMMALKKKFTWFKWRRGKLETGEVFKECCKVEGLYYEIGQIKEKATGMFDKIFESFMAQYDGSVWMERTFPGIKDKHRFMAEEEEIHDVNEIRKMKFSSRKRKEREKRGKAMKRKKTQMKKNRLDRMKDRQLVRLFEGSSDEWPWKNIPDKRSGGHIEKRQVEFDKKGPDNVI
jgi:hypothetical protein